MRVIASARRTKTVAARIVDGAIEVRVPARMSEAERTRHVDKLVAKLERTRAGAVVDLAERAKKLAAEYDLPTPSSIEWSARQNTRWGSCTPAHGTVRISDRLAAFPTWVLDYVIIHELAHLVEANHSARFHELVAQYPLAERAEGFLIAAAHGHVGALR